MANSNFSAAGLRSFIFSEWGVTGKFFGLLLACNWVLLVQADRRWTYWHFGKTIEDIVQNAEVRAEESILRLETANLRQTALGPPEESFVKSR